MSTTGWPRTSRNLRTFPFTPLHRKSGAGRGTVGMRSAAFDFGVWASALTESNKIRPPENKSKGDSYFHDVDFLALRMGVDFLDKFIR